MSGGLLSFGPRIEGLRYRRRPGAYAVLFVGEQHVGVIETRAGVHLPGGGVEAGESIHAALLRECREEIGHQVEAGEAFARALQHVQTVSGPIAKDSHFFLATLGARTEGTPEHDLLWLPVPRALERLTPESHVWAVREAFEARDVDEEDDR